MKDDIVDHDPWLAPDKLYHVLFCFSLTLLFSALASRVPHPYLRTRSIQIGSILSLLAGAAKEAADHFGFFPSAGASYKDAVADVIGVLIASFALSLSKKLSGRTGVESGHTRRVIPV